MGWAGTTPRLPGPWRPAQFARNQLVHLVGSSHPVSLSGSPRRRIPSADAFPRCFPLRRAPPPRDLEPRPLRLERADLVTVAVEPLHCPGFPGFVPELRRPGPGGGPDVPPARWALLVGFSLVEAGGRRRVPGFLPCGRSSALSDDLLGQRIEGHPRAPGTPGTSRGVERG